MNSRTCACPPRPATCAPQRFACNSAVRTGICGSDIDPYYQLEVRRKPTVAEVVRMAKDALSDGGEVYFCNRSSNVGVTVVRTAGSGGDDDEGVYMMLPGNQRIREGGLDRALSAMLLSLSTDAISITSHTRGSVVYNKGEISIMSTY